MSFDELKTIIAEQYGKHPSTDNVDPGYHRYGQYSKVLKIGKNKMLKDMKKALGTVSLSQAGKHVTAERLKKIYLGNPFLEGLKNIVDVRIIDSDKESTKKIEVADGHCLILLDSFTMTFLWMMNKASFYGRAGKKENNIHELYCNLFLHFATAITFGFEKSFPQPKTPPHDNYEDFITLSITTEIQEIFILCHEIAHILIDGEYDTANRSFIINNDHITKYTNYFSASTTIDEELKADELAFEMVLNVYGRNLEPIVKLVCVSIFMKIRYFMWLRSVYIEAEDDHEAITWLARNSAMRHLISSAYTWGPTTFIVDTLEDMEETLEPAAFTAAKIYKEILKPKYDSSNSRADSDA